MRSEKLVPGTHVGPGPWRVLDQATMNAFADATGDHGWLHLDPERAATGPFGSTVASAWHLLSLLAPMAAELVAVEDATMFVYGLGKARFPAPAASGSRIRATADVLARDVRGADVLTTVAFSVECEGVAKPVCVAEVLYILSSPTGE